MTTKGRGGIMYHFNPQEDIQTKYIVFAGPGGSGKTSAACAAAVSLADHGHRTLFIGTDAISHLSDDTDHHGSSNPQAGHHGD